MGEEEGLIHWTTEDVNNNNNEVIRLVYRTNTYLDKSSRLSKKKKENM